MISDALMQLSGPQTLTVSAVSTDVIDLTQRKEIGEGKDLYANFSVPTTCTSGSSSTVTFQTIVSASAALTSPTVVGSSDAIPVASLTAGYRTSVPISPQIKSLGYQFLGVRYLVAGGALTAGAVSCDLNIGVSDSKTYASGFTVM